MSTTGRSGTFRQDLPPPGGYKPIPYERIAANKLFRSRHIIVAFLASTGIGCYLYVLNARKTLRLEMEGRGARFALNAMLVAEKDRAYLTQIRKNRDEEERLMKDVPGWVVGTYYGDPIYKSRPADEWHDISVNELFAHADPWFYKHQSQYHKWF